MIAINFVSMAGTKQVTELMYFARMFTILIISFGSLNALSPSAVPVGISFPALGHFSNISSVSRNVRVCLVKNGPSILVQFYDNLIIKIS